MSKLHEQREGVAQPAEEPAMRLALQHPLPEEQRGDLEIRRRCRCR